MSSRFTIVNRVLLIGLLPLFFLLLVLASMFWAINKKDQLFNTLYENHLATIQDVLVTQKTLENSAIQDVRKYRTGWLSQADTIQLINEQLSFAQTHWQMFVDIRPIDADETIYPQLDEAFSTAILFYQDLIKPVGSDALQAKILNESSINNDMDNRVKPFTTLTSDYIQNQLQTAITVKDRAEKFTADIVVVYTLGSLLMVALVGWLLLTTRRSIAVPLHHTKNLLFAVAHTADLSLRAKSKGQDELAQSAEALNQMLAHFEQLVANIGNRANSLEQQSQGVQKISALVQKSARTQASQSQEFAKAADLILHNSNTFTQTADVALADSLMVDKQCQSGNQIAQANANNILCLAQNLENSSAVIDQLNDESSQISVVVDVIRKISDQTNLLALNAAIEAARAGDAGRGFSVVADEVRTLSANTKKATDSINSMISQLQLRAGSAVAVMKEAQQQAAQSADSAKATGQQFSELSEGINRIHQANQRIHSLSVEQLQTSETMATTLQHLNDEIQQLSSSADQSADASNQLAILSQQLNRDFHQFTISEQAAQAAG